MLQHIERLRATGAPSAKFIVPLIGSFSLNGFYLVLPFLQPITEFFHERDAGLIVSRLSVELASGIQFLHDNNIAHLDIKPENLTLTSERALQIIDFSISVFVTSEDHVMHRSWGTDGYMAPEMVNSLLFNPIKADRYSCGCVFIYFAQFNSENQLVSFALQLTNDNPSNRPPLHDWVNWNTCG